MRKSLQLLETLIKHETEKDLKAKKLDKTLTGESFTLYHLKLLKEMIEKESDGS